LKATVCVDGGFLGEAEISYAGPNAPARAQLAAEVVRARVRTRAPHLNVRVDAIGVRSVWGAAGATMNLRGAQTDDVRLRFAAEASTASEAEILLDQPEALYCAGPWAGDGRRRRA